jgi:hypothetical protein
MPLHGFQRHLTGQGRVGGLGFFGRRGFSGRIVHIGLRLRLRGRFGDIVWSG